MLPPPPRSTLFPYTTLFRSTPTVAAKPTVSIAEMLKLMVGPYVVPAKDPRQDQLVATRSEEHTSELQSLTNLVCRLLLEKKNKKKNKKQNKKYDNLITNINE